MSDLADKYHKYHKRVPEGVTTIDTYALNQVVSALWRACIEEWDAWSSLQKYAKDDLSACRHHGAFAGRIAILMGASDAKARRLLHSMAKEGTVVISRSTYQDNGPILWWPVGLWGWLQDRDGAR